MKDVRTVRAVLLLTILSTARASAEELRVRVLSYNVWGIPVITPLREERMAAISAKLPDLMPDLASFQEVWTDEDAATLTEGLAAIGLVHVERFVRDWPDDSGLLIASRYPIEDVHFTRFAQGRHPHVPWHVDYMAGKGVGSIRVRTPAGIVRFVDTHLQARYGTDDYLFVQMSQALDVADHLRDEPSPVILAGDINSPSHGLPTQLLLGQARLTATDPRSGIDQIVYRNGSGLAIRTLSIQRVLTEPIDFGEDHMAPSDHPALLAELAIETCAGCGPAMVGATTGIPAEILPLIRSELDVRAFNLTRDLALAVMLAIGSLILVRMSRRRRILRAPAVLLLLAATWFAYLSTSFGPAHMAGLSAIRGRLSAAGSGSVVSSRGS
jgi:endonuclease/exonuclease/phosphatase family metal-dependent hydrolase